MCLRTKEVKKNVVRFYRRGDRWERKSFPILMSGSRLVLCISSDDPLEDPLSSVLFSFRPFEGRDTITTLIPLRSLHGSHGINSSTSGSPGMWFWLRRKLHGGTQGPTGVGLGRDETDGNEKKDETWCPHYGSRPVGRSLSPVTLTPVCSSPTP